MENLTRELLHMGVKERLLGIFGTYSWNGGGVKNLNAFAEEIGWEVVAPAAEIMGHRARKKRRPAMRWLRRWPPGCSGRVWYCRSVVLKKR